MYMINNYYVYIFSKFPGEVNYVLFAVSHFFTFQDRHLDY